MDNRIRCEKGQALAEGTAFLVIFTMAFVGLLLLFINTVIVSDYQRKLEIAAQQAAQVLNSDQYFLGAQRKDFNQANANAHARAVADEVLGTLGLPPTSQFSVSSSTQDLNVVTLGVNKLKTVGGIFAPFIPMNATGVAYSGESKGYGYVQLGVGTQEGGGELFVYLPCYGVDPDPSSKFSFNCSPNGLWAGVAIAAAGIGASDSGAYYYAGGSQINQWAQYSYR